MHEPIVLNCYTSQELLLQIAPIEHAHCFYPNWWKNLEKSYELDFHPFPTMKTCSGFIDFYKRAIALPLWSELKLKAHPDGTIQWQFSDMSSQVLMHDSSQRGEWSSLSSHLKLISPWIFTCEEEIPFVWVNPAYEYMELKAFQVLPGVLDFHHQHGTNIQLLVNRSVPFEEILPISRPIAFLFPMSMRPVEIRRTLITQEEWNRISQMHQSVVFTNKQHVVQSLKEKFSDSPYTLGKVT